MNDICMYACRVLFLSNKIFFLIFSFLNIFSLNISPQIKIQAKKYPEGTVDRREFQEHLSDISLIKVIYQQHMLLHLIISASTYLFSSFASTLFYLSFFSFYLSLSLRLCRSLSLSLSLSVCLTLSLSHSISLSLSLSLSLSP